MARASAVWDNPCRDCQEHGRGDDDSDDGHDHGPLDDPKAKYVNACVHTCPLCNTGWMGGYVTAPDGWPTPTPCQVCDAPEESMPRCRWCPVTQRAAPPEWHQQQQAAVKQARVEPQELAPPALPAEAKRAAAAAAPDPVKVDMGQASAPTPGQASDAPGKSLPRRRWGPVTQRAAPSPPEWHQQLQAAVKQARVEPQKAPPPVPAQANKAPRPPRADAKKAPPPVAAKEAQAKKAAAAAAPDPVDVDIWQFSAPTPGQSSDAPFQSPPLKAAPPKLQQQLRAAAKKAPPPKAPPQLPAAAKKAQPPKAPPQRPAAPKKASVPLKAPPPLKPHLCGIRATFGV